MKLLGIAQRDGPAEVTMALISDDEQLASVNGALNAVSYIGVPIQSSICIGPGAGAGPTSSAVLADLIDISRGLSNYAYGRPVDLLSEQKLVFQMYKEQCYYLRIAVTDKPGVLSEISAVLRDHGLSIASMIQNGQSKEGPVFLVLTTHKCAKIDIEQAAKVIGYSEHVLHSPIVIPIFNRGFFN